MVDNIAYALQGREGAMNTIGIENNLDRARIKKLLAIGLFGLAGFL